MSLSLEGSSDLCFWTYVLSTQFRESMNLDEVSMLSFKMRCTIRAALHVIQGGCQIAHERHEK